MKTILRHRLLFRLLILALLLSLIPTIAFAATGDPKGWYIGVESDTPFTEVGMELTGPTWDPYSSSSDTQRKWEVHQNTTLTIRLSNVATVHASHPIQKIEVNGTAIDIDQFKFDEQTAAASSSLTFGDVTLQLVRVESDGSFKISIDKTSSKKTCNDIIVKFFFQKTSSDSEYRVSASANNEHGTVKVNDNGENNYKLTAKENEGYVFDYWTYTYIENGNTVENGTDKTIKDNPLTETVTEDRTYIAHFRMKSVAEFTGRYIFEPTHYDSVNPVRNANRYEGRVAIDGFYSAPKAESALEGEMVRLCFEYETSKEFKNGDQISLTLYKGSVCDSNEMLCTFSGGLSGDVAPGRHSNQFNCIFGLPYGTESLTVELEMGNTGAVSHTFPVKIKKAAEDDYIDAMVRLGGNLEPTLVHGLKVANSFEFCMMALEKETQRQRKDLGNNATWFYNVVNGFVNCMGVDPDGKQSGFVHYDTGTNIYWGGGTYGVNNFFADIGCCQFKLYGNEVISWAAPLSTNLTGVEPRILQSDSSFAKWELAVLREYYTDAQLTQDGAWNMSQEELKETYKPLLTAAGRGDLAKKLDREIITPALAELLDPAKAAIDGIGTVTAASGDKISAARTAYKNIPATYFDSGGYLPYMFRSYEPYKTAYETLLAAEKKYAELTGQAVTGTDPEVALAGVLDNLEQNVTNPGVSSTNGEWAVLALARGDRIDRNSGATSKYLQALDAELKSGSKENLDSDTAYERVTLALSALGIDASQYGTPSTDLTAHSYPFKTYDAEKLVNAKIFALLALGGKPYAGDIAEYRGAIVAAQLDDGAWTVDPTATTGGAKDVDMTAMAIQALAPYYSMADVKEAVDKGLTWLQTQQDAETGGFKGFDGTLSTCSTAQVVTALCALRTDPENWATPAGKTPLSALMTYYNESAGTFGDTTATADQRATEQAAYALVAWDRFRNNRNALYEMSDAFVQSNDAGVKEIKLGDLTADAGAGNSYSIEIGFSDSYPTAGDFTITRSGKNSSNTTPASSDGGVTWTFTVTAEDGTAVEYTISVTKAADPAAGSKADVAAAKAAINAVSAWEVPQATANTSADVKTWIEGELATLDLKGVTATVTMGGSFTAATGGTASAKAGTDGSFSFDVALSKGSGSAGATDSITGKAGVITATRFVSSDATVTSVSVDGTAGTISGETITVVLPYAEGKTLPTAPTFAIVKADADANYTAPEPATAGVYSAWTFTVTAEDGTTKTYTVNVSIAADPAAGNAADVATAKASIEGYTWEVPQATANTSAAVKTWIDTTLSTMSLNGVETTVTMDSDFTAATAGTSTVTSGTDGSFKFNVALSKGSGATLATGSITGQTGKIKATPYASSSDTSVTAVSVKNTAATAGTGNSFAVTLPYSMRGTTITADDISVTTNDPRATVTKSVSGSTYGFTVTAEDGTHSANYTITVSYAENPAKDNIEAVAAAKTKVSNASYTLEQSKAGTKAAVKSAVEAQMASLGLGGVSANADIIVFTAATAGTKNNPNGSSGSFAASVTLTKGSGETLATDSVYIGGAITATQYDAKISVTFTLLGDSKHGPPTSSTGTHTLYDDNLTTWIGETTYEVDANSTVKDVLDLALAKNNMTCSNPEGNYVKSITRNGVTLGQFSNGNLSGWMYTLNGKHPGLGVSQQTLKDHDIIVFHYTDDYTVEDDMGSDPGASYLITTTAGLGGSINPASASVTKGGSQTFTIRAANGYEISDVQVDGASVGKEATYTFSNVTDKHHISATFVKKPMTITASAGEGGRITPSGSIQVQEGGSQTFTIKAEEGFEISNVKVDGTSVGKITSHTFSNVTGGHVITAEFARKTVSITASAGTGGSISPNGSLSMTSGTNKTFTIAPSEGYEVSDVKVDGVSVGAVSNYTFPDVSENHTINVTFKRVQQHVHRLTYTPAAAGDCKTAGRMGYYTCTGCSVRFADADGTTQITSVLSTGFDSTKHVGGSSTVGRLDATCAMKGYTGDTVCSGCGAVLRKGEEIPATGSHRYGTTYSADETGHWRSCTDCKQAESKKTHTFDSQNACTVCGYKKLAAGHTHTPSSGWASDAEKHWKSCTECSGRVPGSEQTHSGGNATCKVQAVCTVCGSSYGGYGEHTFKQEYNDARHWKVCDVCKIQKDTEDHSWTLTGQDDANAYYRCSCGKEKTVAAVVITPAVTTTDKTELKVNQAIVENVAKGSDAVLSMQTDKGTVTIPNDALTAIVDKGPAGNAEMKVKLENKAESTVSSAVSGKIPTSSKLQGSKVVDVTIEVGNQKVTEFSGKNLVVKVRLGPEFRAGEYYDVLISKGTGWDAPRRLKCQGSSTERYVNVEVNHLSTFIVLQKASKAEALAASLDSANTVSYSVSASALPSSSKAVLMIAQYKDGKMMEVKYETISGNKTDLMIEGSATFTKSDGTDYKLFLLDTSTYEPLCPAVEA